MAALLDKLGRAAKYRKPGAPAARLEFPKYSLPWPVAGTISRPFGRERDEQLGTWTVRQGVLFAAAAGAAVTAIAPGSVIFSGPFRSYGKVVIVDHGAGFFSVYGELADIIKEKGDAVRAREKLAIAGERVYLEIRRGTEALDPAEWLEKKY